MILIITHHWANVVRCGSMRVDASDAVISHTHRPMHQEVRVGQRSYK